MDILTENKVRGIIKEKRKAFKYRYDLAEHITNGFIYGPYAKKKHLKADEIFILIDEHDNGGWFRKLLKWIGI